MILSIKDFKTICGDLCLIVRIQWTPIFGSRRRRLLGFVRRFAKPHSKLILGVLLLAPALPVSTEADVPQGSIFRVIGPPVERPAPAKQLTAFMRRKGFAQPYNIADIIQAANRASIPPSMLVCIEFVESSGGKHYNEETNNPLGWKNGKASFPSVREAIRHVSEELGSGQYYAGKTLEEKLHVYNPRPAYSIKVMDCMSQFAQ